MAELSACRGAELPSGEWQPVQAARSAARDEFACTVAGPDGRAALAAGVRVSLRYGGQSTTVTATAELTTDFDAWRAALHAAGAPHIEDIALRVSLGELLGVLTAAWAIVAEVVPGVLADDPVAVPPAGRPSVELALRTGTRLDGGTNNGLWDVVDFSPFLRDGTPAEFAFEDLRPRGGMEVTIIGPLRLSHEDRMRTARKALVKMARRHGFYQAREDRLPGDQG